MSRRQIIILLLAFCLGSCSLLFLVFAKKEGNNLIDYERYTEKEEFMPQLAELKDYDNISFWYGKKGERISGFLRVAYSEMIYMSKKKDVLSQYVFEENPVFDRFGGQNNEGSFKSPNFSISDYRFQTLSIDTYNLYYPKHMGFIGFSDTEGEIVYVFFQDQSLDSYPGTFNDFLIERCNFHGTEQLREDRRTDEPGDGTEDGSLSHAGTQGTGEHRGRYCVF